MRWVDESEVPKQRGGYGPRATGLWADVVTELRANPGKWALVADGDIDSSKVTWLRYRFPDIDFRSEVLSRSGGKPVKVWARCPEIDDPTVPPRAVADLLNGLSDELDKRPTRQRARGPRVLSRAHATAPRV